MTKETVRYPDGVVDRVEEAVDEGIFDSKSEFYRFSAEYVLRGLDPDYEPETYDFEDILDDLRAAGAFGDASDAGDADAAADEEFLEAVATVRRYCFRGEYDDAARYIDRTYEPADREAILLEEFLAQYRVAAATGLNASAWPGPNTD